MDHSSYGHAQLLRDVLVACNVWLYATPTAPPLRVPNIGGNAAVSAETIDRIRMSPIPVWVRRGSAAGEQSLLGPGALGSTRDDELASAAQSAHDRDAGFPVGP